MSELGQENYELENFKFKWEKDKIIINEKFLNSSTDLFLQETSGDYDWFFAQSKNGNPKAVAFMPPNFYFSFTTPWGIFSIVAECNKF